MKKKFLQKNLKVIIVFFFGVILSSSITVYAVLNASDVQYKDEKNVANALNELYSKIPGEFTGDIYLNATISYNLSHYRLLLY